MKKVDSICLVDDDEIFQFVTKRVIEQTRLVQTIRLFSNGKEAIGFLEEVHASNSQLPDIILLDLNMPVMDGWDFLEAYVLLKPELSKPITIYIVSSSISPADILRAQRISEVTDYIIKPITTEKLIDMLSSLSDDA